MYLRLPLLLTLSLSSDIVASGSDKQQNDTSKEAVIDETGNVEMVDPRITVMKSKIKEAIRDGTYGDGAPFDNSKADRYNGIEFHHAGDLRMTSKGMVNTAKPPEGVPKGLYKTRAAIMTIQYGGKTKEMKLKDLYDDLSANEKEWLTFLDHPLNLEFTYECATICYHHAYLQYEKGREREYIWEILDMEKKLFGIMRKNMREEAEAGFANLEFQVDDFVFRKSLWLSPLEGSQIFKRQVAYEIKMGLAPEDWSHQLWMDYRRELKDRGITTPRNIQDVDDEIIVNHMISKSVKFDEKRDNVGLSKILTRFFELNGNVVSQQKKQRIDFFVTGLTKKQYVTLTNVFGGEEGGLTLNEMKDMRKVIYDVDGLKTVLDAMPSSGTE